jgi:hypothetical protein
MADNNANQVSRRVMITIKAKTAKEALDHARTIANFELDESAGAISLGNGEFVVFGKWTGALPPQAADK